MCDDRETPRSRTQHCQRTMCRMSGLLVHDLGISPCYCTNVCGARLLDCKSSARPSFRIVGLHPQLFSDVRV